MFKKELRDDWNGYKGLWRKLDGWRLWLFYGFHYTMLFTILWILLFSAFREGDKTLIWSIDGMGNYFPRLVYLSQTIRDGIQALMEGRGWSIPLYDFRLGPAALDLQIEPLQFLAVLWPWDRIDVLYDLLVLARYYLAGLSFSIFGFHFSQKPFPILLGAISYTFCGFALFAGVRHPQFMAPMIYLPLLLVGAERVMRGGMPYMLIVTVFMSVISSVYFSCMQIVIVGIYVLIRIPIIYEQVKFSKLLQTIGKLLLDCVMGIALAGISVVPTLYQLLNTGRIGRDISFTSMLHYGQTFYERFLARFVAVPGDLGAWTCLGLSALSVPCIMAIFFRGKQEHGEFRWLFVIMTAMLCIPAASYVMSGFNTFSNRWNFGYAFCISAIIMFMAPRFVEMGRRQMTVIILLLLGYFAVCYFGYAKPAFQAAPFVLMGITMSVILVCHYSDDWGKRLMIPLLLAATGLSTFYTAHTLL